jgi:endonuclease/exonuclease/phosphatase family metal-dependent hydrolase
VLADLTGMYVQFWATVRKRGGEYGVGLATSEPVEASFDLLPRLGSEEPRGIVSTQWRGLTVMATHLSVRREVCRVQTFALAELVAAQDGPRAVIGDFNQPRSLLGPLIDAGLDPGPQPGGLRTQIDFVMTGPGVTTKRAWTIPSPASDHLPLVADLEFPASTAL